MSNVFIYHYPVGAKEHVSYDVPNASAWTYGLQRLVHPTNEHLAPAELKRKYNAFQEDEKIPEWKKVAAGFLLARTVVCDEDRKTVVYALNRAFAEAKKTEKDIDPTITNVAANIKKLKKGLMVITTSFGSDDPDDEFPYVTMVDISGLKQKLKHVRKHVKPGELESLIADCTGQELMTRKAILTTFARPLPVPRYWS